MKNRVLKLIILTFLTGTNLLGQTKLKLSGEIRDCKDSSRLTYAKVSLFKNDSLIADTFFDAFGKFSFVNLNTGVYTIQTEYFYYPKSTQIVALSNDTSLQICLLADNIDSLLKGYKLLPSYDIYYFGKPSATAVDRNLIAKKYGVQYISMGCVPAGDFEKYNEVVNKIIEFRNGKGWKKRFLLEVDAMKKK